jgi:hypothetical protein
MYIRRTDGRAGGSVPLSFAVEPRSLPLLPQSERADGNAAHARKGRASSARDLPPLTPAPPRRSRRPRMIRPRSRCSSRAGADPRLAQTLACPRRCRSLEGPVNGPGPHGDLNRETPTRTGGHHDSGAAEGYVFHVRSPANNQGSRIRHRRPLASIPAIPVVLGTLGIRGSARVPNRVGGVGGRRLIRPLPRHQPPPRPLGLGRDA